MALYSEKVMDHFKNPRNVGTIENADGIGEVGNAKCGDIMKIYLKIDDGIITDVKFETFGCGSAIASSSMATRSTSTTAAMLPALASRWISPSSGASLSTAGVKNTM